MARGESLLVEEELVEWSLASAASEEAIPTLKKEDKERRKGRRQSDRREERGGRERGVELELELMNGTTSTRDRGRGRARSVSREQIILTW